MAPTPLTHSSRRRRALRGAWCAAALGAVSVLLAACSSSASSPTTTAATATSSTRASFGSSLPPIHHVFLIALENEGYQATFGSPSSDPYLATVLPASGALLANYYGIGHFSNDNYIALVSGQAPNPLNQSDCQNFVDFPAGATVAADGQISDSGCVFPTSVPTVADQLDQAHLTWKGYMQDMGNIPSREPAVCAHPAIGAPDNTQRAVPGDGYATRHNPFVYFHSIIDDTALCDSHVVPLGSTTGALPAGTPKGVTGLATDLESVATTPNLTFITPSLCSDGHDAPCISEQASPSALTNVDTFLQTWVPRDHRLAGVQAGRPAGDHLRRGGHVRRELVLQPDAGPRGRAAGGQRTRGRTDRHGPDLAVHPSRNELRRAVQPLLDARHHRGAVRSGPARAGEDGERHVRVRRLHQCGLSAAAAA